MTDHYASFIMPDSPIPDPPQFEWIARVVAIISSILISCIIIFIVVEFVFDASGHPLEFGDQPDLTEPPPPAKTVNPEEEIKNIVQQSVLLSPGNKVLIKGNKITYLCTWSNKLGKRIKEPPFPLKLFIDEDYAPWTMRYGDNTWLATVELSPGIHRLRTLVHEVEIFVDEEPGKEIPASEKKRIRDWKTFKLHKDIEQPDQCSACHALHESEIVLEKKGYGPMIGEWKGNLSCVSCHHEEDFQKTHGHDLKTFQDCRQCHVVHGTASGENSLLRVSPKILCIQCHEQK